MCKPVCLFARIAIFALAWGASAVRAEVWPQPVIPADASVETVAGDMLLNGQPSRIVRFQVRRSNDEVTAFYRAEFGPKHVENRVKADRVIAMRQGDYFVTVQLHELDAQTVEGTAMTTMIAGKPVSSAALVDTKGLLPLDSQVVSTVQTTDAGKRSLIVVGVNRNSIRANRDHVIEGMTELGFKLTKQGATEGDPAATSVLLQLSSQAEDASVTIVDAGPYRSVVINRIREGK